MIWRRIDDNALNNNTVWSAALTERIATNYPLAFVERQGEGAWSWNGLAHNITNAAPVFLTRQVSLGSKAPRDRGMLWSWAPHPFTVELQIEMLVTLPTIPGVTLQWFLMTSASATMHPVGLETTVGIGNTGPTGPVILQFDIPLDAVQGGDKSPAVVYLFLRVRSETSNSPADVELYNRANPGAGNNDYRATSQIGLRYGFRFMEVNDTFLRDISMWEITNTSAQDPKGATWSSNFAYQERPFEVILRDGDTLVWIPTMSDYIYPDLNNSIEITRIGELQIQALTVREVVAAPDGPASAFDGLVRGLSGQRSAKGPEHAQLHMAQDQIAYGRVPIFSYGPQISGQNSIFVPSGYSGGAGVDSLTTGATPVLFPLNNKFQTLTEWRIGDDSQFKGDIPNSQRRDIELIPMWLMLARSFPPPGVQSLFLRFTFGVAGVGDVSTHDVTIDITPYSSDFITNSWFGHGLAYQLWFELRTATSSSASFPQQEIPAMLAAMWTQSIILPAPVSVTDNTYLRMEVQHDSSENFEDSLLITDLGTIVRAQPAWSNDGTNIAAVTRDT